jgi:hypothetical protein
MYSLKNITKQKVLIAISLALSLSACSDNDNDVDMSPSTRQVSFVLDAQKAPFINYDNIVVERARAVAPEGQYSYEINDNGYVHVLRNDGYEITIVDESGSRTFFDQTIEDGTSLSFSVQGEATVDITYPGVDATAEVTTPYYTVSASDVKIPEDNNNVEIRLTNEYYSFVTLDVEGTVNNLEIGSAKINDKTPQPMANEVVGNQYSYGYITSSTIITAQTVTNSEIRFTIPDPVVSTQYAYTYTEIDNGGDGGGGIIIDPGWEDNIDIPIVGGGVVSFDQVVGAVDITVEEDGSVRGVTNGQNVWVYEPDAGASEPLLKNVYFNYSVTFASDYYVNLYLLSPSDEKVKANIYGDGTISVSDSETVYASYSALQGSEYGGYTVRNYRENYTSDTGLTSILGNFFLRLGDSNYTGSEEFTVTSWQVDVLQNSTPTAPTPVLPLDNIKGAVQTLINADGSISGITAEDYATRIYLPVSGSDVFSGYTFSHDIITDTESDFINIYLRNPDNLSDTVRLDKILYGNNTGNYNVQNSDGSFTTYTQAEIDTMYGDYFVYQFVDSALPSEGGVISGNFIWRSAESSGALEQNFKVNSYNYTYETPSSADSVIPLADIYNAKDLRVNSDGSVSGNTITKSSVATAYFETDGTELLSAYPNVQISVDNLAAGYWNVYLIDIDNNEYRLTWEPAISQFSVYEKIDGEFKDASDYSLSTWSDVMNSEYANMTLQNWREGLIRGNFMLRLKHVEGSDFDFTITQYSIQ